MASEGTDELYSAFAKYPMIGVLNTLKTGRAVCWLGDDRGKQRRVVMRELTTLAEVTNSRIWLERDWKHWARGVELSLGEGSALYVREWIEGVSLAYYQFVNREKPEEDRARHLFANVAEALNPLHELGKAHGFLKPNNLIMTHEGFAITDPWMGDATSSSSDETPSDIAHAGIIAGDPHYLSPEFLRRQQQVPASDVYSLACVLYEYLTRQKPFTDENPVLIAYQHLSTEAKGIRTRRPDLSRSLEMILRKALSKKPQDRFQHGAEFAEALRGDYTRTQGNLLPKPIPESDPFADSSSGEVIPRQKTSPDDTDPPTAEISIPSSPTVKSRATEFAYISVLDLQRAMATAQANPGATFDKLRELINQERRTVGDSERIPPLFPPQSSAKRLPASAWANAPKMKPSTGPTPPNAPGHARRQESPRPRPARRPAQHPAGNRRPTGRQRHTAARRKGEVPPVGTTPVVLRGAHRPHRDDRRLRTAPHVQQMTPGPREGATPRPPPPPPTATPPRPPTQPPSKRLP